MVESTGKQILKIAILFNTYDAKYGLQGGGSTHFIEVVTRWKNVHITVFAPPIARREIAQVLPGAAFDEMPSLPVSDKALDFLLRAILGLTIAPRFKRFDAILLTSHSLPDVLPSFFARCPTVVLVSHLIESRPAGTSKVALLAERLALSIMRRQKVWIAPISARIAKRLDKLGFQRIGAPVQAGATRAEVPSGGPQRKRLHAIFIGRIHRTKGVRDAILAWREVNLKFPTAILNIVGPIEDEEYDAQNKIEVARLSLDSVIKFHGKVNESAKQQLLRESSVFVFPSYEEGWGIVIGEAMTHGLPCVTYDLPVYDEIFPEGRIIVPVGDVFGLAEAIISLFTDSEMFRKMSEGARRMSNRYSWEATSAAEFNIVLNAIEEDKINRQRRSRQDTSWI